MSSWAENIGAKISMLWNALELLPKSHPTRGSVLINLGNSIHTRFVRTGDRSDLNQAIVLHREALSLLPAPHPHRQLSLNGLAKMNRLGPIQIWVRRLRCTAKQLACSLLRIRTGRAHSLTSLMLSWRGLNRLATVHIWMMRLSCNVKYSPNFQPRIRTDRFHSVTSLVRS